MYQVDCYRCGDRIFTSEYYEQCRQFVQKHEEQDEPDHICAIDKEKDGTNSSKND
jgi:hypothetical protein